MPDLPPSTAGAIRSTRIQSVDALRGFTMFLMIFVNDLAGAGRVVPDAMVHYSERHRTGSGMTFVDLVFPAFLFIVGLSIPLALGGRLARGESWIRLLGHIVGRTFSLMAVGILMVHETPDTAALGWSGDAWCVLMYLASIAAFVSITPRATATSSDVDVRRWRTVSLMVRCVGMLGMFVLALVFRGAHGERILTLSPLSLSTEWYGILGLIAWAYLVACLVFLVFRHHRTALLGCLVLLLCLFAAERGGMFEGFWLSRIVGIGGTLGSLPAISVGGVLLGSMLTSGEFPTLGQRTRFTGWFVLGCSAAALLLEPLYGIGKNQATPSWCLWSCAITAAFWYGFHWIADVRPVKRVFHPLAIAGQNVFLAYLLSEMLPGLLQWLGWGGTYGALAASLPTAILRSALCGVVILLVSTGLNRLGFRLRL